MFDYCEIKNSLGGVKEILFYGDIVSSEWDKWSPEDTAPMNVKQLADEIGDSDVNIRINSNGGDVFAGFAICNILKGLKGRKTVYIDGLAASIASVIAMAGDIIIMPENSFLMIHKPWSGTIGNADDLRKLADTLDSIERGITATYMSKAAEGVTEDKLSELINAETWLSAKEAAEIFGSVEVEAPVIAAASLSTRFMDIYRNGLRNYRQVEKAPPAQQNDLSEFEEYLNMTEDLYSKID